MLYILKQLLAPVYVNCGGYLPSRSGSVNRFHRYSPPLRRIIANYRPGRMTPRKYVFDVTSIGQRSSPWTRNSVKVEIKFRLECKLHFPGAQLMLWQMHLTKVFESIEAKYWVSWPRWLKIEVTARQKKRLFAVSGRITYTSTKAHVMSSRLYRPRWLYTKPETLSR